jgi:hypothetical protein
MATLDEALFTYNPFTTADIWGAPPSLHLEESARSLMPLGQDDSALPSLANPAFGNPQYALGSNVVPPPAKRDSKANEENGYMLIAFIAVLAVALYVK